MRPALVLIALAPHDSAFTDDLSRYILITLWLFWDSRSTLGSETKLAWVFKSSEEIDSNAWPLMLVTLDPQESQFHPHRCTVA